MLTVVWNVQASREGVLRQHPCPQAPGEGRSTCSQRGAHFLSLRVRKIVWVSLCSTQENGTVRPLPQGGEGWKRLTLQTPPLDKLLPDAFTLW